MLEILHSHPERFRVTHVNARFSLSISEIGESSLRKLLLSVKYLWQAIAVRCRMSDPVLYYIPGPVKWSSVIRDWILLSILRRVYPKVVFHWHAIGQGEWAHGSFRCRLPGSEWADRYARRFSAKILESPDLSIAVSSGSTKDALAVGSVVIQVVNNGLSDPCAADWPEITEANEVRLSGIEGNADPVIKLLFLSHGTEEKGLMDALAAMTEVLRASGKVAECDFELTLAGGVAPALEASVEKALGELLVASNGRLKVHRLGFVTGDEKSRCYREHDVFLAPSRWESFGLTVAEAMAFGKVVVACGSDGVSGVLPKDYPYVTPVSAPDLLAESMIRCFGDLRSRGGAELGVQLGKALRQRFLDHFQVTAFGTAITDTLASVLDAPRGSHPGSQRSQKTNVATSVSQKCRVSVYLADQNPGHDRSFGISRMSQMVLTALQASGQVEIKAITSRTSQHAPANVRLSHVLPWGTRRKWVRLLTDHFHPLFQRDEEPPDLYYFPKGYIALLSLYCRPSVVTIHDTIIQHDADQYPEWRTRWEYGYWALMLKNTLRNADRIMTVSESAKQQITDFMLRHRIPKKEIAVTYEPCAYEHLPQPVTPRKKNFVVHLASVEPHKRTEQLIRWWHEAECQGRELPALHLIGSVPEESKPLLEKSSLIEKRPFLDDRELQDTYAQARALILPSEIEGFGLPALEAYYLGTPVCFVKGTSVEEILSGATAKGGFNLDDFESFFEALEEIVAMNSAEIRSCGLKLREIYASEKVVGRMLEVFSDVAATNTSVISSK